MLFALLYYSHTHCNVLFYQTALFHGQTIVLDTNVKYVCMTRIKRQSGHLPMGAGRTFFKEVFYLPKINIEKFLWLKYHTWAYTDLNKRISRKKQI